MLKLPHPSPSYIYHSTHKHMPVEAMGHENGRFAFIKKVPSQDHLSSSHSVYHWPLNNKNLNCVVGWCYECIERGLTVKLSVGFPLFKVSRISSVLFKSQLYFKHMILLLPFFFFFLRWVTSGFSSSFLLFPGKETINSPSKWLKALF